MNSPKICLVTGAWQRHKLFELFCEYYADLKKKLPFELELVVAVSEQETKMICRKHGHTDVFAPNSPLTRKFNAATMAARDRGADYTLNIGSDDFLTEGFLMYYVEQMQKGFDFIAPLDWYFYDVQTRQGLYWAGYDKPHNKGMACGAGRALSKRFLDLIDWQPWPDGYDRVLDTGMQRLLDMYQHSSHIFSLKEHGIFALDVKTNDVQMTKFAHWPNTFSLNGLEMLKANLPEYVNKIINV